VKQLVFSPDGTILASGSKAAVRLWRVETGQCIIDLGATFPAFCNGYSLSFTADSNYLIATSTESPSFLISDEFDRIWKSDISDMTDQIGETYNLEENPGESSGQKRSKDSDQTVEIDPDDQSKFDQWVCGEYDLCVWRIDTGKRVMELTDPSAHVTIISSDMSLIATQDLYGLITIRKGGNVVQTTYVEGHTLCRFDKGASQIIVKQEYSDYKHGYFPILQDGNTSKGTNFLVNPIHLGYAVNIESDWVLRDGRKVLWIPRAYRDMESIVAEKVVMAAGCSSGHVLILR
jgi:hypothetical protein